MTAAAQPADETVPVDAVRFARAETDTYFDTLLALSGGPGRCHHARQPVPVDEQTVIRMNRDTLYSTAIVDITAGAELTITEANGRYRTAMIVDQDHYVNQVFDSPGRPAVRLAIVARCGRVAGGGGGAGAAERGRRATPGSSGRDVPGPSCGAAASPVPRLPGSDGAQRGCTEGTA
ncbi:MAG TPA: DUF1254 domain-containing protein [Nakamurella sp.]|nr:DUF1254 domain-containing protein [Nakamurella sp.]